MDFHRLTRRELQALCKKNKIPANMTNVAMAESVKALEIVEGLEKFLQTCESENAQSSIESPVRSELTSPYVPPTGGRSTRRRNVAKEEPKTAKPSTRIQCTTRRTLAKYADEPQVDAVETPAVVPQTNRKKGSIASACRKMDSQLKECVEEEKKDVLVTPAQLAVTSRRRRVVKEESEVKRVYSTRRSARLVEKNLELLNEVQNENSGILKKDLFTIDGQNVQTNLQDSLNDLDELSGITGVDASTTVEKNPEKKDESEAVSAEKQDICTVNEVELIPTIEEEMSNHSEADGAKAELKESSDVEIEEVGFGSEIEAKLDIQKCDKTESPKDENIVMPLNVSNKAQENDGVDTNTTVEENSQKKDESEAVSAEKQDMSTVNEVELVPTIEEEMSNHSEADGAKSELKESSDVEIEEVGFGSEIEAELEDYQKCDKSESPKDDNIVMPLNVSNKARENDGCHADQTYEIEIEVEKIEEQNTDKDAGYEDQAANSGENVVLESEVSCDIGIHNEIAKEISNVKNLDSEDVSDFNVNKEVLEIKADVHVDLKEFNPDESDSVILEATEESADITYQCADDSLDMPFDISLMNEEDEASKWDAVIAYFSGRHYAIGEKDETNLEKDTELELQRATKEALSGKEIDDIAVEEPGEIDIVQLEESKKAADQVPSNASNYLIDALSCGEAVDDPLTSIKNPPSKQVNDDFPEHIITTSDMDDEVGHQISPSLAGLDSHLIVEPTCLTPIRTSASKASAKMKRITAVSDNKENIGSGSKLVLTKERVKITINTFENVPKLNDLSMRQLTKMLKEKLQITNELSKNENDNETPARPALQALPENC